jgi:hypothetical protein
MRRDRGDSLQRDGVAADPARMSLPPAPDTSPQLTIKQTATGWWTVQRGSVQLAGAMTRTAAERERELLRRLSESSSRRAGSRAAVKA